MPSKQNSVLALGLAAVLSACGQGGDAKQSATATKDQPHTAEAMAAHDASNPFAGSEEQMHDGMMAAGGSSVSEMWARKMIEHHRGALTMSEVLLKQDPNSRFASMARTTIRDQGAEIRQLEKMLNDGAAGR